MSAERWFNCVPGVVAEVDGATHCVKVVMELFREGTIYDEWIPVMVPWVGPDGYGPVNLPEVGSEVLVFGRYGQKYTHFCIPIYNEDFRPPEEFADGSRGLKTDTAFKLLADLQLLIAGQQEVSIEAQQHAKVTGQAVRLLTAGGGEMFRAEGNLAGFRGAAIGRRTLPSPGPTDTPLTVAIRQLLIDLGLAQ